MACSTSRATALVLVTCPWVSGPIIPGRRLGRPRCISGLRSSAGKSKRRRRLDSYRLSPPVLPALRRCWFNCLCPIGFVRPYIPRPIQLEMVCGSTGSRVPCNVSMASQTGRCDLVDITPPYDHDRHPHEIRLATFSLSSTDRTSSPVGHRHVPSSRQRCLRH